MDKIIKVQKLVKKYKKAAKNAVDGVSFGVEKGDFFALLGPNGAGKTTAISVLTTLLSKTSGEIEVVGFDVDKDPSEVRKRIGIIFQSPSLDLNLTAEENIRFHTILYGLYSFRPSFNLMPEDYKHKVDELAKVLDIHNEIFQPIKTFSGGMRRKLEIIRSLMHSPKVLFLDEPTAGLDPASRKSLWEYLMNVRRKERTTIFLTTHYLEEAEEADRICIINDGKVVSLGTPEQIKKDLVEEYLILDAEDRGALRLELEKYEYKFSEDEHFTVHLDGTSAQKVIQSISTSLTLLETHIPSLEEAYLEIIENSKRY